MRKAVIDFTRTVAAWDGFGFNYVEAAQTRDYQADSQEYGGFSILGESDRQTILDLVFGDDLEIVLLNLSEEPREVDVQVIGSSVGSFAAWRTSETEEYLAVGDFSFPGNYAVPPRSVTTFYARGR